MFVFGKQTLTIMENQNAKNEGKLTKEEQSKLDSLNEAKKCKKFLEPLLYETFILVAECFKVLI